MHSNADDKLGAVCKKQLPFGKKEPLADAEAEPLIMAWLLAGESIDRDCPTGRTDHLAIQPRDLPFEDIAVLEQRAQAYWATFA